METRKRNLSFIGILLGMVSSVLMQTIIATSLPVISNELSQRELYGWVFSSYMIASIVTIPLFSNLADIHGRKIFYLGGMFLFLMGSLLSGFSQSMPQLIVFRVIQGLGAGAIAPSAIAMISKLFNPDERVKMLGLLSAFQVLANIVGPVVGGFITEMYSWRWTFFINLPIGLLAFMMVKINYYDKIIADDIHHKDIDYIGSITLGLSTVLFIFSFQLLGNSSIGFKQISVLFLAIALFAIFIIQERKHPNPILLFDFIRIRNISLSLISMFLLGSIIYSLIAILPLYGQYVMLKTLDGAKMLLVFSTGIGFGGILSGKLSKVLKITYLTSGSWLLTILGLLLLILYNFYSANFYSHLSTILFIGIGLGINLPIFLGLPQNSVPDTKQAVIGGMVQISRNLGGAVSVPLLANIIVINNSSDTGFMQFVYAFTILLVISFLGLIFGLGIKKYV